MSPVIHYIGSGLGLTYNHPRDPFRAGKGNRLSNIETKKKNKKFGASGHTEIWKHAIGSRKKCCTIVNGGGGGRYHRFITVITTSAILGSGRGK